MGLIVAQRGELVKRQNGSDKRIIAQTCTHICYPCTHYIHNKLVDVFGSGSSLGGTSIAWEQENDVKEEDGAMECGDGQYGGGPLADGRPGSYKKRD